MFAQPSDANPNLYPNPWMARGSPSLKAPIAPHQARCRLAMRMEILEVRDLILYKEILSCEENEDVSDQFDGSTEGCCAHEKIDEIRADSGKIHRCYGNRHVFLWVAVDQNRDRRRRHPNEQHNQCRRTEYHQTYRHDTERKHYHMKTAAAATVALASRSIYFFRHV